MTAGQILGLALGVIVGMQLPWVWRREFYRKRQHGLE